MKDGQISLHLVKVWRFVKDRKDWFTAQDVKDATQVAERTSRNHITRLVKAGILESAPLFPEHRYRLAGGKPMARGGHEFVQRLDKASEIFGDSK